MPEPSPELLIDDTKTTCPKCGQVVSRQSTRCAPCKLKLKPTIKPTFQSLKDDLNNIRLEAIKNNQKKDSSKSNGATGKRIIVPAIIVVAVICCVSKYAAQITSPVYRLNDDAIVYATRDACAVVDSDNTNEIRRFGTSNLTSDFLGKGAEVRVLDTDDRFSHIEVISGSRLYDGRGSGWITNSQLRKLTDQEKN